MKHQVKKRFLLYFLTLISTVALSNCFKIIEFSIPSLLSLTRTESQNAISWTGSFEAPIGEYFLSVGRPQGSCELIHNGSTLDNNSGSRVSERSNLYIASKITVQNTGLQLIILRCTKEIGSPVRLIHVPYLATYRVGLAVQLLRIFCDFFTPLIAIIIAIMFILFSGYEKSFKIPPAAILNVLFVTFYLFSLVNLPRLFLLNKTAFYIHVFLKVGFVFSMYSWILGTKKASIYSSLLATATLIYFTIISAVNYDYFFQSYVAFICLIPMLGMLIYRIGALKDVKNQKSINAKLNFFSFLILSSMDIFIHLSGQGSYITSAGVLSIFLITTFTFLSLEKSKSLAGKSVSLMASKQLERNSTTESLSQISMILSECLKMKDWSIYLDSYNLGFSPQPGRELRRISSSNTEASNTNLVISLEDDENFGSIMKSSLQNRLPTVSETENGGIYAVIPIGSVCCINLSTSHRSKLSEEFINLFIAEAFQQINAIALTIIKFESTASFSVTLLKEELGIGTHDLEFGAIFADAVGFTQNVKSSSKFIEFFERDYLSSLLRNLDKKVVLKDLFGDELYLVVLPNSITHDDTHNIYQTTMDVVNVIQEFSKTKGAELCNSAGFKPIEFRIGANAGPGQIVVSQSNIALSGPVIEAKRCQGRAHASEPFVTAALIENASESIRSIAIKETYAAKKELLSGFRLGFKNKAA